MRFSCPGGTGSLPVSLRFSAKWGFVLFIFLSGLLLSAQANTTALPTGFPLSQLGAKADEKAKATAVEVKDGFACLTAKTQALEGLVGPQGLTVRSTSKSEGAGSFTIKTIVIGRANSVTTIPNGYVYADDEMATLVRPGLTEEITASSDGIRQDFVIQSPPVGKGPLRLILNIRGARAQEAVDGIFLRMACGRKLAYSKLLATDAHGKELAASMKVLDNSRIALVVNDAAAEYPVRIDPTVSDADWVSMGELPGVNGTVFALASDSTGNLFVGGDFTGAGGREVNHIAKWDGSTWGSLGSGMDSAVYAITCDAVGNVYVGGKFINAGGVSANHIAKWNGSIWVGLGTGMTSTILSLACDKAGNLYAGGGFSDAGGVPVSGIAVWNGSTWSGLGTGIAGVVRAIAFDDSGKLYVGGDFSLAGGLSANNIAEWNGFFWSALGQGVDSTVYAIICDRVGNVYAGGAFRTAGSVTVRHIAKWSGTSWLGLGLGMDSAVKALASDPAGRIYAGGNFTTAGQVTASKIAYLQGSYWEDPKSNLRGFVQALVWSAGGMCVGGRFNIKTGGGVVDANNMAKWDGGIWSTFGSGMSRSVSDIICDETGNLYAAGNFVSAGAVSLNWSAKWTGSKWVRFVPELSSVGTISSPYIRALAAGAGGDLYIGGGFNLLDGQRMNFLAKWDGSSWNSLGLGTNEEVMVLEYDGFGGLYAGGLFDSAGGLPAKYIAKWNGSTWNALGSGLNFYPSALSCDTKGNLYAAGRFDTAGGVYASRIAKWNGSLWCALGSGISGGFSFSSPKVLACDCDEFDNLYVGGIFSSAGGISANNTAKWDGASWSCLGSGTDSAVSALVCDPRGNVFVGGIFRRAGGVLASGIAKWDGSAWSALGSGVNGYGAWGFATDAANNIYACGHFLIAGGKPSAYLAKWTGDAVAPIISGPPTPGKKKTNVFGPTFRGSVPLIRYNLVQQERVRLEYCDVNGKRVATVLDRMQGAGQYSVSVPIAKWPSGTYFQVFKAGEFDKTDRFVIIR